LGLEYNIDFEIAAAVFDMVLWVCMNYFFVIQTNVSKAFRDLVMWALVATIFDLTTALTISYGVIVPCWFNNILNTIYFITVGIVGYSFSKYVNVYVKRDDKRDLDVIIGKISVCIFVSILLANIPLGFIYSFNETEGYVHGPLYALVFILPVSYLAYALFVAILNRKSFTLKQMISFILYVILILIGMLVQFFLIPNVLITMFFVAVAIWITFLSMETPDYQLFVEAMLKFNEATAEARAATSKLLELSESKDTFMKSVTSEIKGPVTKINAYSQKISAKTADKAILLDVEKILDSIESIDDVLTEINDYISLSDDEVELNLCEYSPSEMFHNAIELGKENAREKNLDFEYEIDEKFPKKLFGDRSRLSQIIASLIANAIKFTQTGKVKLRALWHQEDKTKGSMRIEVEDTGVGMRKEEREGLNKTLKSGMVGLNPNVKGRGLGLSIAARFLSLMGSKLQFKSDYGKGTTFSFDVKQGIDAPLKVEAIELEKDITKVKSDLSLSDDLLSNKLDEVNKALLKSGKLQGKPDLKTLSKEEIKTNLAKQTQKNKEIKKAKTVPVSEDKKREIKPSLKEEASVKGQAIKQEKKLESEITVEGPKGARLKRGDFLDLQSNLKGIDVELGLKYCMNDAAFYKDMLKTYVENEKIGELLTYINMNNWDAFLLTLRSVKNTSQTIGAMELAKMAKGLELALKKGDRRYILENAKNFITKYQEIINVIKTYQEEV